MFISASVGKMRAMPRPGPSGLNSRRPVAAAKLPRGKSPQLNQPGLSGSGTAPVGRPTSSIKSRLSSLTAGFSSAYPFGDQLLGLGDRLRRVEALGASVRAIHDRVAAVETERILQAVEPLAGRLVAAVGEPSIGLEQDRRPQEFVGIPPIARAAGRT